MRNLHRSRHNHSEADDSIFIPLDEKNWWSFSATGRMLRSYLAANELGISSTSHFSHHMHRLTVTYHEPVRKNKMGLIHNNSARFSRNPETINSGSREPTTILRTFFGHFDVVPDTFIVKLFLLHWPSFRISVNIHWLATSLNYHFKTRNILNRLWWCNVIWSILSTQVGFYPV